MTVAVVYTNAPNQADPKKNPPWKAVLTDVVSVSRFTGFEWTEGLFDKHLGGLNPYSCGRGFNKHLQRNRVS